ncbi:hypothetical protein [Halomonas shantousis]
MTTSVYLFPLSRWNLGAPLMRVGGTHQKKRIVTDATIIALLFHDVRRGETYILVAGVLQSMLQFAVLDTMVGNIGLVAIKRAIFMLSRVLKILAHLHIDSLADFALDVALAFLYT